MQKVYKKTLGLTLEFRVGNDFNAEDYSTEGVVLIRRKGAASALFGKVVGSNGKTHYPLILVINGKAEHYCGFTPELAKTLEEVLGELPQELKVFLVDAANHSECWRKFRTSPHMRVEGRGVGCKHGLLLARAYEEKKKKVKEVFLAPLPVSGEEDEYFRLAWLLRFKEPVLLIGEPGCGKTFLSERVANLALSELQSLGFKAQVFRTQGNSSIEGISLLGVVRGEDGKLRLHPGDFLRAFMFAGKSPNHRAVVVIDEVFRIHPREQSVIVSALTEVWRDGKPHYLLKHPDFPKLEVWVPKERLWVIATGNLGGNFKYSVASDSALLDRFSTIWMTLKPEKLASVIQPILQKKGWEHLLQPLLNLRVAAEELVKRGELSVAPSIRTFRMIEHAERPEDILLLLKMRFPASSQEEAEAWEQVLDKVLAPALKA